MKTTRQTGSVRALLKHRKKDRKEDWRKATSFKLDRFSLIADTPRFEAAGKTHPPAFAGAAGSGRPGVSPSQDARPTDGSFRTQQGLALDRSAA